MVVAMGSAVTHVELRESVRLIFRVSLFERNVIFVQSVFDSHESFSAVRFVDDDADRISAMSEVAALDDRHAGEELADRETERESCDRITGADDHPDGGDDPDRGRSGEA